jgi:hypothetical protein
MSNQKYTKELLTAAAAESSSIAGVLRYVGLRQAGGNQSHIGRLLKKFEIDTSHFTGQGHNRGKPDPRRKTALDTFVVKEEGSLRTKGLILYRVMLEDGFKEECEKCGTGPIWNGKPLRLEVDHVDGNWLNNLRENLRFLCPNCHSQEENTNRPHKYRVGA